MFGSADSLTSPEASISLPALFLSHGAPPLVDDVRWTAELRGWAADLPNPSAILVVSAHWESAPLALGATEPTPLVYDTQGTPADVLAEDKAIAAFPLTNVRTTIVPVSAMFEK